MEYSKMEKKNEKRARCHVEADWTAESAVKRHVVSSGWLVKGRLIADCASRAWQRAQYVGGTCKRVRRRREVSSRGGGNSMIV